MDTAASRGEWIGRVVDERFPLLAWLGGSDHSAVYRTELAGDPSQKAAIKLMQVDDEDADACIAGWTAAKTLAHPHLTRLMHTGRCQIDGQPLVYAVTEYADEILSEILVERALTASEAEEMLGPLLDALQFLHGKGFVHGGLKPSNILVIEDQLKVSSDGVQAAGSHARRFAEPGPYDAPELSTYAISPAADIWSLGMTLVETLTQHLPAWDRSVAKNPVVPESIPQPFAGLVRGCLRTDPASRYTLGQVRACLQPGASRVAVDPEQAPIRREIKGSEIEAKEPSKPQLPKLRVAALLLLGMVALAIVAVWLHRAKPSLPEEATQSRTSATGAAPQAAVSTEAAIPKPHASSNSTVASPAPAQTSAPASVPTSTPAATSTEPAPATSSSSVKGAVADRVMPDIPSKATATIQGKVAVEIRVAVDARGNVSDAVIESDGHGRYFANLALEAVRNWKFTPPQIDGRPIPSAWILHFVFRQTGTEVAATQTAAE